MDTEEKIENACDWIQALASAEFPKAVGRLAREESRCCLGVANDLLGRPQRDFDSRLSNRNRRKMGIKVMSQIELIYRNDGLEEYDEHTHPEIAVELLKAPENYFERNVAAGVREYFIGD